MKIKFKKLAFHAETPSRANDCDAGYDLTATDFAFNPEYNFYEYGTGIAVSIPKGYVGLLFPRSSVSKKPLTLANCVGVVDSGYHGEVALRFKATKENFDADELYGVGDRVGQLVVIKHEECDFEEVEELEDTERGEGGFGSSDLT